MRYPATILSLTLCAGFSTSLIAQTFADAKASAKQGRADEAIVKLTAYLAQKPTDADAHALLCTVYVTVEKFDDGVRECEAVERLMPRSSDAQLALARAYGSKADHAGAFTGMRLVGKIRDHFERAVQYDGKSVEALSDLGQFYVDAPGIVGGGTDKAQALVAQLTLLSAARGHRLAAMVAAKKSNYAAAEAEFQKEIDVAHTPESYVDLAKYWKSRKQWDRAEAATVDAIKHDTRHGADSVEAAGMLVDMNRNLPLAVSTYRGYLSSSLVSYGTPAFAVRAALGKALVKQGQKSEAQREFAAALALAHDYPPARKGLNQ